MSSGKLLKPTPIIYRKPRPRPKRKTPAVTPAALTLVSAEYESTIRVTLTFSRAINIAGIDGNQITVDDGIVGFRYAGLGFISQPTANAVELMLEGVEELPLVGVTLNATALNGIVASGDGSAWTGVTGLELPFP